MSAVPPGTTRRVALRTCTRLLTDVGLGEPGPDARVLVEEAVGLVGFAFRATLEEPIGEAAAERLAAMLERRLAREPVFRILGRREFWGLDLAVTPAVLDPRPDTETLVRAALRAIGPRRHERLRVLDLGTGSGAILLALLSELPRAVGAGIDSSPEACAVARRNAQTCGLADRVDIRDGDFGRPDPDEPFDLIVSNPPYVERAAIDGLDPEVRDHDPRAALDGGPDGLDAYRAICPTLPGRLARDGIAAFEIGATQAAAVAAMIEDAGLRVAGTERDLGGHERAVWARR